MTRLLLSQDAAGERLNISRARLYELIKAGDLAQVSMTGKKLITIASIETVERIAIETGEFCVGDAAKRIAADAGDKAGGVAA